MQRVTKYAGLSAFAALGCLGRLILSKQLSIRWPNSIGCLVYGLCLCHRRPLDRCNDHLYLWIATGFCGSFTTFSSWQNVLATAWYTPNGVRIFLESLAAAIWLGSGAYVMGRFGFSLADHESSSEGESVEVADDKGGRGHAALWLLLHACLTTGVFLFAVYVPKLGSEHYPGAIGFGIAGMLLRYLLARTLNKDLYVGTFAANVIGTVVLTVTNAIVAPNSWVTTALVGGFCGCLSTLSTFIHELATLRAGSAWKYFLVTVGISQIAASVVLLVYHRA